MYIVSNTALLWELQIAKLLANFAEIFFYSDISLT